MNCGHVEQGPKPKVTKRAPTPPPAPASGTAVPINVTPEPVADEAPAANVAPEIHHDEPATAPKKTRRVPKLAIIIAVVLLVFGGAGAFAFQAVVLGPQQAPGKYLAKLVKANTAVFSGNVKFTSEDEDYANFKLTTRVKGKYDITDPNKPRFQMALDGSFGDGSMKGELILLERMLYFRAEQFDLLSALGMNLGKDWYKYELPEESLKNECAEPVEAATQKLASKLPLKDPKLVKLFDKVDGRTANHYRGAIDLAKLPAVVDEVNKDLSADCKMDAGEEDLKNLTITYDLWSSSNFDRLVIVFKDSKTKSTIEITLDTSDYNKAVQLEAPAGAKDAAEILGSAIPEPDPADEERREELQAVQSALERYYASNGYYPAGNYAGLKTPLVATYLASLPVDPGGKSYVYTPSGCRSKRCAGYQLKAVIQNNQDPDYPEYVLTNEDTAPIEPDEPAGTALLPQLRAFVPFWQ